MWNQPKIRLTQWLAAALVFAGGTTLLATHPWHQPGAIGCAQTANLCVATSGNDATAARGDLTKPCATWSKCYQLAQCGDTVSIAAGAYPAQELDYQAAKDSCSSASRVQFIAAPGATVSLPSLKIGHSTGSGAVLGAKHVYFNGFTVSSPTGIVDTGWQADDIVYDGIHMSGLPWIVDGASNVTLENSDGHDCSANASQQNCITKIENGTSGALTFVNGANALNSTTLTVNSTASFAAAGAFSINGFYITYTGKTSTTFTGVSAHAAYTGGEEVDEHFLNTNITLNNVTIHDFSTTNASYHTECLYLDSGTNITIEHSRFYRCQIFDLFAKPNGQQGTILNGVHVFDNDFGSAYSDAAYTTETGACVQLNPTTGVTYNDVEFKFNSLHFDNGLGVTSPTGDGKNHGCELQMDGGLGGTSTNGIVEGNAGIVHVNTQCVAGYTWSNNVEAPFSAGQVTPCGTNNTLASATSPNAVLGFTNTSDLGAGGDYSLAAGSTAIGYVTTLADCPVDDINLVSRPSANHPTGCNAGAHENR